MQDFFSPLVAGFWRLQHWGMSDQALLAYIEAPFGKALAKVKEELGAASIEQVVYAWVRALPSRPLPLLGSSKIERIRTAVSGLSLTLNREQWYRIWEASNGSAVP